MLVDSHCHLNFPGLVENIPAILSHMHQAKIIKALTVGTIKQEWPIVQDLVNRHAELYAAIGIHPDQSKSETCSEEELIQMASHSKVVALGETGLDYHYEPHAAPYQKTLFITHLQAAQHTKLPIIIHSRDAATDTIALLKEYHPVNGVLHCFTENCEVARQILDLGLYISISGIVTFKNAHTIQEVARYVPLDRLLIETDSPYLAPVPHRGELNEPAHVRYVAECIAMLRNIPFVDLADKTTENFFMLFSKINYHDKPDSALQD
jgi:TatD DNase family protein